jgi:hypothetical protein
MSEWRKCTTCKKSIEFNQDFHICNVTTCQKKRAGLVFCSVECWDAHLPVLRHKEAWAIDRKAPSEKEWREIEAGLREDTTYPAKPKAVVEAPPPPRPASTAPAFIRRKREDQPT